MLLYNPCTGGLVEVENPTVERGVLLDMEATYTCEVCGCDHTVSIEPEEASNTGAA